jgi:hypothetical protein
LWRRLVSLLRALSSSDCRKRRVQPRQGTKSGACESPVNPPLTHFSKLVIPDDMLETF